jgi:nitrogen fixation NifU-like protein
MPYTPADYTERVLDHYENPRNAGEIESPDAVAVAGNPACGDLLKLYWRVREGRIEEVRFKAYGCAAAIAASSMTTVLLTGRSLEDAASLTNKDVSEALGGLPPMKEHCSVLAEDAVRAALADYRSRQSLGA